MKKSGCSHPMLNSAKDKIREVFATKDIVLHIDVCFGGQEILHDSYLTEAEKKSYFECLFQNPPGIGCMPSDAKNAMKTENYFYVDYHPVEWRALEISPW